MFVNRSPMPNVDPATVKGFGREWLALDQTGLADDEALRIFGDYFRLFRFNCGDEGFDLGCGSGRWARLVAPKVGKLHLIDPSDAIYVAMDAFKGSGLDVEYHNASADQIPLPDGSQDFGYCLGVLHHIPDTQSALSAAVRKLKPGGQFLLYVYYAFDNRPAWYRAVWRVSDIFRRGISRLPFALRRIVTFFIAALVYWPLSRLSRPFGPNFPLWHYRNLSFYTMRTDALDRFGTRLEKRFSKDQIRSMMTRAGLTDIRFSSPPYWVAHGVRSQ